VPRLARSASFSTPTLCRSRLGSTRKRRKSSLARALWCACYAAQEKKKNARAAARVATHGLRRTRTTSGERANSDALPAGLPLPFSLYSCRQHSRGERTTRRTPHWHSSPHRRSTHAPASFICRAYRHVSLPLSARRQHALCLPPLLSGEQVRYIGIPTTTTAPTHHPHRPHPPPAPTHPTYPTPPSPPPHPPPPPHHRLHMSSAVWTNTARLGRTWEGSGHGPFHALTLPDTQCPWALRIATRR